MKWLVCSPDLDPIENFSSILRRSVYISGWQFTSKYKFTNTTMDVVLSDLYKEIQYLTKSIVKILKLLFPNMESIFHINDDFFNIAIFKLTPSKEIYATKIQGITGSERE